MKNMLEETALSQAMVRKWELEFKPARALKIISVVDAQKVQRLQISYTMLEERRLRMDDSTETIGLCIVFQLKNLV